MANKEPSEKLKRAALALINMQRKHWGQKPIEWDCPTLTDDDKDQYIERAEAVIKVWQYT